MALDLYHDYRRANASGGIVRLAGDLGLGAAFAFWLWVHWSFIGPSFTSATHQYDLPSVLSGAMLAAFAVTLALCNAVVQPALHSAIFPNTAAAQLLQDVRRQTWGWVAILAANVVLYVFSGYILWHWWAGRIGAAAAQVGSPPDPFLTWLYVLVTLVFFVVVPAWATNYGSPVVWLAEVQQAQQVRKLKLLFAAELATLEAAYYRAKNVFALGLANASMEDRAEAVGIMRGIFQAQNDSLQQIAAQIDTISGVKRRVPLLGDQAVTDRLDTLLQSVSAAQVGFEGFDDQAEDVPATLSAPPVDVLPTLPERAPTLPEAGPHAERSTAAGRHADVLTMLLSEPQRASVTLSEASDPRDQATLAYIRERFGRGILTAELLADELRIGRSTADRWVAAWREAGQVEALKQRGLYRLTEGGQR
jgi:hypothetical protein